MKISDIINESLNTVLPYKWTDQDTATFTTPSGDNMVAVFTDSEDPTTGEDVWDFSFYVKKGNESITKATGTGGEFAIFSTIKAIFAKWLSTHTDHEGMVLRFSADTDSRQRLYRRFVKQFVKQGWELDTERGTDGEIYTIRYSSE